MGNDDLSKLGLIGWTENNWEYVYRPKGIRKIFKAPKIRYLEDYYFWYKNEKLENGGTIIKVQSQDYHYDGFSIGILVRLMSMTLGSVIRVFAELAGKDYDYLDNVMKEMIWVSGVHDVVCRDKLLDREMRADLFNQCCDQAYELGQVNKLRVELLKGSVTLASKFGAC